MIGRVAILVATQLLVIAGPASGALQLGGTTVDLPLTALFLAAFALVGLVPLKLELWRYTFTVTLTEAVLVVALLHLEPLPLVLAVAAAETLVNLRYRIGLLKILFNATSTACAAVASATVLHALTDAGAHEPEAWLAGLVAVATYSGVALVSTSAVIAITESRRFRDIFLRAAPTLAVTGASSACFGLGALILFQASPGAPLLLVPLVTACVLEHRRRAVQQAERLRFERLYEASSNTSSLTCFEEALASLAGAARTLVTGAVGVCCAIDAEGRWSGIVLGDEGARLAPADVVEALVALGGDGDARSLTELPAEVQEVLPGAVDAVVAASRSAGPAHVVLAVLRENSPDEQSEQRADVLGAFAVHAALTVANVQLYESVEAALRHQVDLNRQKAEFVAAVSHELRTPLTAALGAIQTVRRLGSRLDPSAQDQLLTSAMGQGERLRRLIEDLLLVAAAEHRSMRCDHRPIEVGVLLDSVTAAFTGADDGDRVQLDSQVEVVVSDEDKLHRILANLVENAVKYAPDGPIEVSAAHLPGGAVSFTVADRGPGIPAADRERIFERFVQLDQSSTRSQGGTGLGLYLCRQLADLLGGTLTAAPRPGGGAVFSLCLPERRTGSDDPRPIEPAATAR